MLDVFASEHTPSRQISEQRVTVEGAVVTAFHSDGLIIYILKQNATCMFKVACNIGPCVVLPSAAVA